MRVNVIPPREGFYGNIHFPAAWPMRAGKFPKDHPVGGTFGNEMGESAGMQRFRKRGYWASCFPEGDGITFKTDLVKPYDEICKDVRECFGWDCD